MNIRDLKYIVSVADLGNFGKAAEACNISQPALSMQIKKLEDQLGVQIFERKNKQFLITPVGEKLVAKARHIIQQSDEFVEIGKSARDPYAGRVTIAAFPTLAPYYFPNVLPKIAKKFPKLKLFLVEDKTANIIDKLNDGSVDVAFLALPIASDNFEVVTLFKDNFLVAVSKENELAKHKKIQRKELKNEKLLLLEEGHCLRSQALEFCEISGAGEVQDFRATSLETLRHMVAANIGITLMPEIAAIGDNSVKYIEFESNAPSREIAVLWRKSHPRAKVFAEIASLLK